MSTDPRIEAAARALNREGWTCFDGAHEPGNYDQCADCRRHCNEAAIDALAAADKSVTITDPAQLAALPANTRIESQVGPNFDYWNVHGDLLATCLSAAGYVGPVTEIKLPARVIHWGQS